MLFFEMFQKMAPNEQPHIVDKLGIRHLNEIHGLEKMNNYPPDKGATAIVPGELVDLSNSNNIIDKEVAKRNLETTVNSKDLQHMGINEVHGPAMVGDFVAIKENIFSFLHAGVVESVSKDGTITVIEKLGSTNQLPVIRQTLQDFSRTWRVNTADIKVFRKQ
jgi:hypothetical protein